MTHACRGIGFFRGIGSRRAVKRFIGAGDGTSVTGPPCPGGPSARCRNRPSGRRRFAPPLRPAGNPRQRSGGEQGRRGWVRSRRREDLAVSHFAASLGAASTRSLAAADSHHAAVADHGCCCHVRGVGPRGADAAGRRRRHADHDLVGFADRVGATRFDVLPRIGFAAGGRTAIRREGGSGFRRDRCVVGDDVRRTNGPGDLGPPHPAFRPARGPIAAGQGGGPSAIGRPVLVGRAGDPGRGRNGDAVFEGSSRPPPPSRRRPDHRRRPGETPGRTRTCPPGDRHRRRRPPSSGAGDDVPRRDGNVPPMCPGRLRRSRRTAVRTGAVGDVADALPLDQAGGGRGRRRGGHRRGRTGAGDRRRGGVRRRPRTDPVRQPSRGTVRPRVQDVEVPVDVRRRGRSTATLVGGGPGRPGPMGSGAKIAGRPPHRSRNRVPDPADQH